MIARWESRVERMNGQEQIFYRPTWAEVDLDALRHNFRHIKGMAGRKTKILSVIKADAYGHGMIRVAKVLNEKGADFFGVADIREAISLRLAGIKKPIVIFENTLPIFAKQIVQFDLRPSISSWGLAISLNRYARSRGKHIFIHVKIDTGMGRLGVWHRDAMEFVRRLKTLSHVHCEGLMTHFAAADTDEHFTQSQTANFMRLLDNLRQHTIVFPYVHAANSIGFIEQPNDYFNLVRPGLILYGLYPTPRLKSKIALKPVLSIKSRINFLKNVERGRNISYGRTFVTQRPSVIATLPIGYNDGYFRCFSNNAFVLVRGRRCPVVGRVTMDQLMIDVTDVVNPKIGAEVVLLGRQGQHAITADELALRAKTINYEITCSLGNRIPRVYRS